MTDRHLSMDDYAARLRERGGTARTMMIELVHRSWCGDARHDQVLAGLSRVIGHLDAAASRLAGAASPSMRAIRADIAGLLAFVAALGVALLFVPVPARPVAVSVVVMTAVVVGAATTMVARSLIRRRALSAQPAPLLAVGAGDEGLADALRQLRAGISELLPDGDPPSGDIWDFALDQTRAARDWLDLAAHSMGGSPRGSAQA